MDNRICKTCKHLAEPEGHHYCWVCINGNLRQAGADCRNTGRRKGIEPMDAKEFMIRLKQPRPRKPIVHEKCQCGSGLIARWHSGDKTDPKTYCRRCVDKKIADGYSIIG